MKDTEFNELIELTYLNGVFTASNQEAINLVSNLKDGQKINIKNVTARDIKLHRCYFALLNYIWSWMPEKFRAQVPRDSFYKFLKIIQGQYDIVFEFKDGTKMIEYHSISFSRMSNDKFREFIKDQISIIYNDVIMPTFNNSEQANDIIKETEKEFEKFFSKL